MLQHEPGLLPSSAALMPGQDWQDLPGHGIRKQQQQDIENLLGESLLHFFLDTSAVYEYSLSACPHIEVLTKLTNALEESISDSRMRIFCRRGYKAVTSAMTRSQVLSRHARENLLHSRLKLLFLQLARAKRPHVRAHLDTPLGSASHSHQSAITTPPVAFLQQLRNMMRKRRQYRFPASIGQPVCAI